MEGERGRGQRIQAIAAKFREKGATSPERAMTAQELGLPPRFEEAMHRRLGATGIFVDVGGKYYLDEAKLSAFQQRWQARGDARSAMLTLRIVRMVIGVSAVLLALTNIFLLRSLSVSLVVLALVVLWVVVTVVQISYLARMRARWNAARQA